MNSSPLMHPALASMLYKQRHNELSAEAANHRLAASLESKPNRIDRFRIARREGKVTWIETIQVHRSA